jgi:adenine-specific DNA-methyltransferase
MPTLEFKGKQFVYAHHLTVPFRQLNVVDKKSAPAKGAKPSLEDNLIIHGDNLHALKALLPQYAGRIKCIYIDPPYNTGNEGWCYNDKVNSPLMKEWLKKSANPVDKEDLERHDKWLSMMWPRLQLLRELLADDGVIFISCDDNEQENLVIVLKEIFGESNFISCLSIRANPRGRQSDTYFATVHDYLLCIAKNKDFLELNGLPLSDENIEDFDQEDADGELWRELGLRQRGSASLREDRQDMYFPIYVNPIDGTISLERNEKHSVEVLPRKSDGRDGRWMWSPGKVLTDIKRVYGRKVSGRDEFDVFIKDYLKRGDVIRTAKPKTMLVDKDVNTESGGKLLKQILGSKVFDYPKPVGLLTKVLQIATDKDSIILDSFAGSGTTAHAVLALNKEDGGNRKFILVECEDYADSITAERVRRVIKGVPTAKDESLKSGLGGSFAFCELGDEINIENLLKGENLPSFEDLARYAFYTATGQTLDKVKQGADFYVGETANYRVHVAYKPELEYLRASESALNMPMAERISASLKGTGKTALVFATHKFMGQKELKEMGILYCQLPYQLHRVMGE